MSQVEGPRATPAIPSQVLRRLQVHSLRENEMPWILLGSHNTPKPSDSPELSVKTPTMEVTFLPYMCVAMGPLDHITLLILQQSKLSKGPNFFY